MLDLRRSHVPDKSQQIWFPSTLVVVNHETITRNSIFLKIENLLNQLTNLFKTID